MLDPAKHAQVYQRYFSAGLGKDVEILSTASLEMSSRSAPWRFDLLVGGQVRSFVLRLDAETSEKEYHVLKAVRQLDFPCPAVYGLDKDGSALGEPCFFMEYIEGEPLLTGLLAGEVWAADLYLEAVVRLISVPIESLSAVSGWIEVQSAEDVLEAAHLKLKQYSDVLSERVYQ